MTQSPKYKGVPIKNMSPEQVDRSFAEVLEELTDEQLDLVLAEIGRIIARRSQPK